MYFILRGILRRLLRPNRSPDDQDGVGRQLGRRSPSGHPQMHIWVPAQETNRKCAKY